MERNSVFHSLVFFGLSLVESLWPNMDTFQSLRFLYLFWNFFVVFIITITIVIIIIIIIIITTIVFVTGIS